MLSEYWLSEKLRRKCKEFANNIVFLQPKRLKNYLDMKKYFLAITLLATVWSTSASDTFWLGADISGTSGLEAFGAQLYNAQGEPRENTVLMREYGLNAARFRVWVNPKGGFSSKEDVLKLALRAKEQGMAIMIDFHYSDWWADPGKQNIPKAWEQMSYEEMCQALAQHTRKTLNLLKDNAIDVKWVQVGNETTNGFLWPMGRAQENMKQYAGLTRHTAFKRTTLQRLLLFVGFA